jgi:hypothetical protein
VPQSARHTTAQNASRVRQPSGIANKKVADESHRSSGGTAASKPATRDDPNHTVPDPRRAAMLAQRMRESIDRRGANLLPLRLEDR